MKVRLDRQRQSGKHSGAKLDPQMQPGDRSTACPATATSDRPGRDRHQFDRVQLTIAGIASRTTGGGLFASAPAKAERGDEAPNDGARNRGRSDQQQGHSRPSTVSVIPCGEGRKPNSDNAPAISGWLFRTLIHPRYWPESLT